MNVSVHGLCMVYACVWCMVCVRVRVRAACACGVCVRRAACACGVCVRCVRGGCVMGSNPGCSLHPLPTQGTRYQVATKLSLMAR